MPEKKNPWKSLKESIVYENDWIRVEHHDVLNPSNKKGIYGMVHFKNTAIGIIPVDHDRNTWLVGQHRYPLENYSWEIPEGGGPLNIPALESAKRELKEETGIIAKSWTEIQEIHTSNSVTDECGIIYLAEDLSFGKSRPEESEELIVKKVSLKKAIEMVFKGEITDSLSVAGLLKLNALEPSWF